MDKVLELDSQEKIDKFFCHRSPEYDVSREFKKVIIKNIDKKIVNLDFDTPILEDIIIKDEGDNTYTIKNSYNLQEREDKLKIKNLDIKKLDLSKCENIIFDNCYIKDSRIFNSSDIKIKNSSFSILEFERSYKCSIINCNRKVNLSGDYNKLRVVECSEFTIEDINIGKDLFNKSHSTICLKFSNNINMVNISGASKNYKTISVFSCEGLKILNCDFLGLEYTDFDPSESKIIKSDGKIIKSRINIDYDSLPEDIKVKNCPLITINSI